MATQFQQPNSLFHAADALGDHLQPEGGSEANDVALSLSQALTGRQAIATRERAYHGLVGLARDVTVQPHWHGGWPWPKRVRSPNGTHAPW